MAAFPYSYFERVRLLVAKHHGMVLDEDFGVDVTITARFVTDRYPAFNADLKEVTRGEIEAEIIDTNENTIFPSGSLPSPS
jgi:hypothetical protein